MPFREPRLVERGTENEAEHGPGAGLPKVAPKAAPGVPVTAFEAISGLRIKVVPR